MTLSTDDPDSLWNKGSDQEDQKEEKDYNV